MIEQEINLYQDRFKEKIVALSFRQILLLILLVSVGLAYSSYWYQDQYQSTLTEKNNLTQQKQQVEDGLKAIRAKLETILANNQFEIEIKQITRDITVRKHMINFVSKNQFGSGEGFSERLAVLSQVAMKDVWLDQITLSDEFMKLSGSALKEENVPEYFNRFKNVEEFKQQKFEVFEMDRPKEQDWKVDFVIASTAAEHE